jgi:hypothetical protein
VGVTPIYNIPFAEPTNLVRDWPQLSEDVALAIEAALEDIPVTQKKIAAFTGSGTWTVPAGVTYAIAHVMGGGGGVGSASAGNGGNSSVAFASGTVTSNGGPFQHSAFANTAGARIGQANSGNGASVNGSANLQTANGSCFGAPGQWVVAGSTVTPAASISVTVGAGGTAGTNGAAGGSGYVYIEYFEEV